jgi:hypothetical protein
MSAGFSGEAAMTDVKLSLILLSAPFLLLAALAELGQDFALYRHVHDFGTPATAIVQSIEPVSYVVRPEGGRTLTYRLDLPGPALINGEVHLSDTDATRYSAGQEIGIVYAATDPSLHALSVGHAWIELVNTLIVVAAYGAVLALAMALLRTSRRKSWRD